MMTDDINKRIANLSAEKRALLELRLKNNKNTNTPRLLTIPQKRIDSNNISLSFAQQRLWFLDQLEPNSSFYNIPTAFHLSGSLNVQVLQEALNAIVARHEILRTTYISENGSATQIINLPRSVELQIIDLQPYSEGEQKNKVRQWLQQESQKPFNLASDMMLRGCLLQLTQQSHVLLLVMHHIASDGWSIGILWEEVTQFYKAFLSGQPNPLSKLPIQYADFAIWQREWVLREVLDQQLNYWKKQLAGANQVLELPTDHPRPAVQSYRGASQFATLPQSLSDALKKLCSQQGCTLYMGLLAAFKILLYRYSMQEDIIVGSPIAGRNRTEIEGLIGFFVNTLVLRTNLSGNPSFQELLERIRSVTLDAFEHQDLPFEKLVEELNPERSLSYNSLFQVMFVLQNASKQGGQLLGLIETPVELEATTSKFDLTLSIEERNGVLITSTEYNTDLFSANTIKRMNGHFQTLLEGIIENPKLPIAELSLLTKNEKQQLLIEWNNTYTDYPKDKCIHQLFEDRVEETPDAVAVVFKDRQLTYRELNNQANQLAHYLQKLGVGPNRLVGICVERSLEMIVGLLGILKAGGAYVPIDPYYPQERIEYMINNAQVKVLLTQQQLVENLPIQEIAVVYMDTDWHQVSQEYQTTPISSVTAVNTAYVNYTSGSTGKPKGVETLHRGVTRLLFGVSYMNLNAKNKFLQMAPISFDASTLEIWGALLHGAQCVLFLEKVPTATDLRKAIQKYGINTLWLTSALFNSIIDTEPTALRGIQQLLTGGEALSVHHVEKAIKALPSTQVINGYGPTESTTFACCYQIPKTLDKESVQSVPIGRPIGNTQIYLLDTNLQLVPIGTTGEIYIGGAGLARGYLNRIDLTQEKFISNPFGSGRLYKTGDYARYKNNGDIMFLGRIDDQVKIRGFRVELGEIETAITQFLPIQETCVIADTNDVRETQLIAYFVAKQKIESIELHNFLQLKLPRYMIPSFFMQLDFLPLTPNGKVDRRALPSGNNFQLYGEKSSQARDTLEQKLIDIWKSILGHSQIGIYDDFFALGGHSLLSVRLVSEIEKNFNLQFPLSSIFEISTISKLAECLRQREHQQIESAYLCLEDYQALLAHSTGRPGTHLGKRGLIVEIPLVNPVLSQPFIWIGEVRTGKNLKLDQTIYAMPSASGKAIKSDKNYIPSIASLLLDELLTVQPLGPYFLGGYCFDAWVAMEIAQQLQELGKEVKLLTLIDRSGNSKIYHFIAQLNQCLGSLRFHLSKISKLSLMQKCKYIFHRVRNEETVFQVYENDSDIQQYWDAISSAQANYKPIEYTGQTLLINASRQIIHGERDQVHFDLSGLFPYLGMGFLLKGKVHTARINCDHLDLIIEPYSEEVGRIIQQTANFI